VTPRLGDPALKKKSRISFQKSLTKETRPKVYSDLRDMLKDEISVMGAKEGGMFHVTEVVQKDDDLEISISTRQRFSMSQLKSLFTREFTDQAPVSWMLTNPIFQNIEEHLGVGLGFDVTHIARN